MQALSKTCASHLIGCWHWSAKQSLRLRLQDDATHKTVFRISGSIPAVNYIKLPKDKALNLHGRFCYLQVMFKQDALFVIHLEAMTTDSNTCRVSIGNVKAGGRKVCNHRLPGQLQALTSKTATCITTVQRAFSDRLPQCELA
eukprot:GHRR01034411.1.p1 GENE.GHRR01034411.1~~GHRR01034411.1.p1  ORF type:complete len:143 (+),score=34.12 GHRR01034411.1:200-628(+)